MTTPIPSAIDIRARLVALPLSQLERLAELSGVPLPTLTKIRYGQTVNPGIETVRQFMPHLPVLISQEGAPAIPDPALPRPDGRPCIDVAAPAVQQEVRDAA